MVVNRRQFFRLQYPVGERPSLVLSGVPHPVVDISERGIRFQVADLALQVGAEVFGAVRFHDGSEWRVSGQVVRVMNEPPHCALELEGGIPLPKILEEQRYLIRKYRG